MAKKQTKKTKETAPSRLLVLDLGCGDNKINADGVLAQGILKPDQKDLIDIQGVDLYSDSADVKFDLSKGKFPFEDESVDGIFSNHFIEHLDGHERINFFNETYRILKKGARMRLIHPYYKSSRAVQDPTHKFPPIAEESYWYWDKNWREINKLGHYLGNCDFEFSIYHTFQDVSFMNKNEETRNFAIRHYFNVIADMIADLIKR